MGHRQSSSNCSQVREAEIRAQHLSPHSLMLPSCPFLFLSILFSIPLSSFSTNMTSICGCLCCSIPVFHPCLSHSHIFRGLGPSAGSLRGCALPSWLFWGTAVLLSVPCVQAGGAHQEGQAGAAPAQALALGWESCSGGTGTEGLSVPGAVPSLGAH